MGAFLDATVARIPSGLFLPEPLRLLWEWVETNGFVVDVRGELWGQLYPVGGPALGSVVELHGDSGEASASYLRAWFGSDDPLIAQRVWAFADTGGDGSRAALWLGDDGVQRVVHLGSGSGSMMTCVLAEDPVDFLRLIAIDYRHISDSEEHREPPRDLAPNGALRDWVTSTFGVSIPSTAAELLGEAPDMGDEGTDDVFNLWVQAMCR